MKAIEALAHKYVGATDLTTNNAKRRDFEQDIRALLDSKIEQVVEYLQVHHRDDDDAEWEPCCNLPERIRAKLTEEQCMPTAQTMDDSSKEDLRLRGLNRTADALDMGEQLRLCHRSYGVNDLTCMKPKGHKGAHGK